MQEADDSTKKAPQVGSSPTGRSIRSRLVAWAAIGRRFRLAMFSDYQCLFCRSLWSVLDSLVDEATDGVAVTVRRLPIDALHPQARAARAACRPVQPAGESQDAGGSIRRCRGPNARTAYTGARRAAERVATARAVITPELPRMRIRANSLARNGLRRRYAFGRYVLMERLRDAETMRWTHDVARARAES